MSDRHTITINNTTSFARVFRTTFSVLVLTACPILLGRAVDSTPLQWLGFVFGLLIVSGIAMSIHGRTTFKTTDEARAYLDKIDRGEAA